MRIAIIQDYSSSMPTIYREGITVHTNYLCNALLRIDPTIYIEFWQHSFNTPHMKKAFKSVRKSYPDRVGFYDDGSKFFWRCTIPLFYTRVFFKFLKVFFRIPTSGVRDAVTQHIIAHQFKTRQITTQTLLGKINKYSKAQVFFTPYCRLELSSQLDGVKVMQVHDLMTIPLRDEFAQNYPNIDEINKSILDNLAEYVKNGAYFFCSAEYTKKDILKYIPSITSDRVVVAPHPPMIGDFSETDKNSVELVKGKYNITKSYIFMASQNRSNKNWVVLLKALINLRDQGVNLQLVTTGCIRDIKKCAEIYEKFNLQDQIIQTGSLSPEDLIALYKGATMVVIPTMFEGPGMSQQGLEAMKLGIPVIHAKSMGMTESLASVGLNFDTADLNWFEYDDDDTLAQKIKEVLISPKNHVEKQRHIFEAYAKITWNDVGNQYLKVFQNLITQREE